MGHSRSRKGLALRLTLDRCCCLLDARMERDPCSGGAKEGQVLVPTRQKIIMSQKWGFTKFSQANYVKWKQENRIVSDGVNAKLLGCHGPLA